MNAAKFTPGPWSAEGSLALDRDGNIVARVESIRPEYVSPDPMVAANARLISAAPALYAALVKANATLTRFAESGFVLDPFGCAEIDEALAKAVAP